VKPQAACLHPDGTSVAISCAGSPDQAAQVAAFWRHHQGPGHKRVERLPKQKGDPRWGQK
jgi:hypothetical protein